MMIYKKNKRAQAESQFHWVFVLIAGAAILAFFVTFAYRHKAISEKKEDIKFANYLDMQVSLAEVTSKSTNNRSDLPYKDIKFSCEGIQFSGFEHDFNKKIVFAPTKIKTSRLYISTYQFSMPFKVTNFVYIIAPNVNYIFITDENDPVYAKINSAISNIPSNPITMSKYSSYTSMSPDNIKKLQNFPSIRFIFIDKDPSSDLSSIYENFKNKEVSALYIKDKGLTFYQKTKSSFTQPDKSYYLDDASLLGAIITDNKEMYDCMMANAFERLYQASMLYTNLITKFQSERGDCSQSYSSIQNYLDKIKNGAGGLDSIEEFNTITQQQTNDLIGAVSSLDQKNNQMKQYTCPTIY